MKGYVLIMAALVLTACQSLTPINTATPTAAVDTSCTILSETQVAELLDVRWYESLKTKDPARVVENYAPRSLLVPTISDEMRFSIADKQDYFAHFLALSPIGRTTERQITTGCNMAVDTGHYEFLTQSGVIIPARYAFTYALEGDKWLIVSHHSSPLPQTAPH